MIQTFNKLNKIVKEDLNNKDINVFLQHNKKLYEFKDIHDYKKISDIYANIKTLYDYSEK